MYVCVSLCVCVYVCVCTHARVGLWRRRNWSFTTFKHYIGYSSHYIHTLIVYTEERNQRHISDTEKPEAAVVDRLHVSSFKRKIRARCPDLAPTYHSSFHCIYPLYSLSSDGMGPKMTIPCIGAIFRAGRRTRVVVVEFHVSLYPNSVSPFFPLYTR